MEKLTDSRTLYCIGCNARFPQLESNGVCPRCGVGVDVNADTFLAETLLIREPPRGKRPGGRGPDDGDAVLEALIGSDLDVYRCEALLGRGGMGHVYLAYHTELYRHCALKILSPRLIAVDKEFVARFASEGRTAAALIHPNVVTTHAVGHTEQFHFLEMEFVPGRSLQQLLEDEGTLPPVRSMRIAAQIATGLAAAHRAGIVHRDLKPDNVLMSQEGVPKIGDFGLAKRIVENAAGKRTLAGTPHFMAPELFRGEPASPASDVYALGVTLFLMLTGRLPFTGSSLSELGHVVATERVPSLRSQIPEISLELAECVNQLLAKNPSQRPADAVATTQLLHAILGEVRDIASLLGEAFGDDSNVSWIRADSRYQVVFQLPDGRKQKIFIEPSEHAPGERLLLLYSVCCDAQPEYYEEALRLNSEVLHGGIAIREIDGRPKFIMLDTFPRATVGPDAIRRSGYEIAQRADAVEKLLTGLDVN
jgi:serine/threonine-protein kinase